MGLSRSWRQCAPGVLPKVIGYRTMLGEIGDYGRAMRERAESIATEVEHMGHKRTLRARRADTETEAA